METISAHKSVIEMHNILHKDNITNSFDRAQAQGKRCSFCEQGISCQLCSNGPCRIKPGAERGVCGIDADGMAMRNFMFLNTMGTATYTFHAKTVAKSMKATALGKTPFQIKDEARLRALAGKFGIKTDKNTKDMALAVSDAMMAGIHEDSDEESSNVLAFAPKQRIEVWRKLGILPGG